MFHNIAWLITCARYNGLPVNFWQVKVVLARHQYWGGYSFSVVNFSNRFRRKTWQFLWIVITKLLQQMELCPTDWKVSEKDSGSLPWLRCIIRYHTWSNYLSFSTSLIKFGAAWKSWLLKLSRNLLRKKSSIQKQYTTKPLLILTFYSLFL